MRQWVASLVAIVLAIAAGVVGPIANWPAPVWVFFILALAIYALASAPLFRVAPAEPGPVQRHTAFIDGDASGSEFHHNNVRADYFIKGDAREAKFSGNSFNESAIDRILRRSRRAS